MSAIRTADWHESMRRSHILVSAVTYLDQPPRQEYRQQQSHGVQGDARDLSSRTRLPVVREEVVPACAVSRYPCEVLVKLGCAEYLEPSPRRG